MNKYEFGEYLRNLRGDKSTRQIEIQSGVSKSYISLIERGEREIPTPEILKKIAPAYGVTYEELMINAEYINSPMHVTHTISTMPAKANTQFNMTFSKILKKLRREKDLSQEELGKILKYGRTAISGYESGRNEPSYDTLKKLSDYFC